MIVINACNVQIMNATIGICRETNQIYIFQVLAHLLQNPLEITLFTFPAMRNPSRAVLFISKLATKSLLMLQRSRSQVPQQRPRPTNLTFWNWTAATQVEQKNLRYNNQWNFSKTCSENMLFYVCNFSFWLEFNYLFFTHCYETFTCTGYGGLSVVIEGPHRSEIECKHYENRKYKISYSPHEPGIYILNLRFADDHLPGNIIGRTFAI